MNPEQITGLIRQFLPFVSGIATALGLTWFDGVASAVMATIGPVGALISVVWSLVNKKEANIVTMAAVVPGVRSIALEATPEGRVLATATPPNVAVAAGDVGSAPRGAGNPNASRAF